MCLLKFFNSQDKYDPFFSRIQSLSSKQSGQSKINSIGERFPINRTLMEVIKGLEVYNTEMVERSKTIFFPGDPAEKFI